MPNDEQPEPSSHNGQDALLACLFLFIPEDSQMLNLFVFLTDDGISTK